MQQPKLEYLGADPEVFIKDVSTGEIVSAHNLIPGTKSKPHPVKLGALQVDGMLGEFNILPASSETSFVHNTMEVMAELKRHLGPKYDIVIQPCADFSAKIWASVPEEAKILGCDPDYNAYSGEVNEAPNADVLYRTAAGHIHFGWCKDVDINDPGHFSACQILAKELDFTLAYPAAIIDNSEGSHRRRLLYGTPGSFRPKSYGMEYRVLSNFWLSSVPLTKWIYKVCHKTFSDLLKQKFQHQSLSPYISDVLTGVRPISPRDVGHMSDCSLTLPPGWRESLDKLVLESKTKRGLGI